jgi:hypothetical protein
MGIEAGGLRLRLPEPPRRCRYLPVSRYGYPVPATTLRNDGEASFAALSERRKLALAAFDWCGVCGLPFRDESRWIPGGEARGAEPYRFVSGEVPLHEICMLYAVQACPFLKSPNAQYHDETRAGQARKQNSTARGYRRTTDAVVAPSEIEPDVHTLQLTLEDPVGQWSWVDGSEVADRYQKALGREADIAISDAEEQLVRLFNDWGEDSDTVAGAAVMAGGAFLRGIRQLQRAGPITDQTYATMAGLLINTKTLDSHEIEDPATVAVFDYLREGNFGDVLTKWRTEGRRHTYGRVGRNDPCPCGSGRKFKHCHG